MTTPDIDQRIRQLLAAGVGRVRIARETGATTWQIRKVAATIAGKRPAALRLDPRSPIVRSDLVRRLLRGFVWPAALAKDYGCTEADIAGAVRHLGESGYNVLWDGGRARILREPPAPPADTLRDHSPLVGGWHTFGVISDTHLASTYARLDVLEAAYNAFAAAKVRHVYHAGNIADGHAPFNRFELFCHGATDQALYVLDHYPQRKGITTHFITGNCCHETWWFNREGLDFGRYLTLEARDRGRHDLNYLGFAEADVELAGEGGTAILRLMHPGGGSAYALSYAPQKIVESFQGGEKPAVLILGHFHKASYDVIRNVHVVQAACCQDQTRWMRGRKIDAYIGFWIVRLRQDASGAVRKFVPEFENYFDRSYHVRLRVPPAAPILPLPTGPSGSRTAGQKPRKRRRIHARV